MDGLLQRNSGPRNWLLGICLLGVLSLDPVRLESPLRASTTSAGAPSNHSKPLLRLDKVLVHYLDREGRHTLSPSLYERDAYQAWLRRQTNQIGGLCFDIHWRAPKSVSQTAQLRLQLRTSGGSNSVASTVLEDRLAARPRSAGWTRLRAPDHQWRGLGPITAWRAAILDGGVEVAELKSFLW